MKNKPPAHFGRYQILGELGRGGMATVYRANDPRFGREVAIKVLPPELLHDPSFFERFDREARTIASLEHSAIVPVYDYGEENGQPYLVMRYMNGGSLEDRIRKGYFDLSEASRIFTRLAPALDQAHQRGIVHRDLKPGNILFDASNDAFLSDFGIVKLTAASHSITGSGILGTPAYMSPEQGRGRKDIDGRSDVYALGCILYQLLTGKLPYDADTPTGMIIAHLTEPVPNLQAARPDLPYEAQQVLERAMAKDREQRYTSASQLANDLQRLAPEAEGPETKSSPTPPAVATLYTTPRPGDGRAGRPQGIAPTTGPTTGPTIGPTTGMPGNPADIIPASLPAPIPRLASQRPGLNLRLLFGLLAGLVLLLIIGAAGVYGIISSLAKRAALLPTPATRAAPQAAAIAASATQVNPTYTPAPTGPTPLWMFLQATYTPMPVYVNTPHARSEAYPAAMRAYARGDYAGMLSFMQQAAALEPGSADVLFYLGEANRLLGDYPSARQAYQQAINLNPSFAPAYLGRARLALLSDPTAYTNPSSGVSADFQRAIHLDPGYVDALIQRAGYFIVIGNAQAALADLSAAEKTAPYLPELYINRSKAELLDNNPAAALEAAQHALALDQTSLPAYLALGNAYLANGEPQPAIASLQTYLLYNERDPAGWLVIGNAYQATGQNEQQAREAFQKVIQLEPGSAWAQTAQERLQQSEATATATAPATGTPRPSPSAMPAAQSLIAYETGPDGAWQIVLSNPDGSQLTSLPGQPANSGVPAFSPDGTRLAFRSRLSGSWQVYTLNLDGSGLKQLTRGDDNYEPSWSPDGRQIVYVNERSGEKEIYRMNADGSGARRLTNHPGWDDDPSFSPDGSWILFESKRGEHLNLFKMRTDGSQATQVSLSGGVNSTPAWSPDGAWIAFEHSDSENGPVHLWVMDAGGGAARQVTFDGERNYRPAWSADGRYLAFTSNQTGEFAIWVVKLADNSTYRLSPGSGYDAAWQRP